MLLLVCGVLAPAWASAQLAQPCVLPIAPGPPHKLKITEKISLSTVLFTSWQGFSSQHRLENPCFSFSKNCPKNKINSQFTSYLWKIGENGFGIYLLPFWFDHSTKVIQDSTAYTSKSCSLEMAAQNINSIKKRIFFVCHVCYKRRLSLILIFDKDWFWDILYYYVTFVRRN